MGHKTIKENIRVEVDPRDPGDFGIARIHGLFSSSEQQKIADCEDIAAQIRRHVDGLPTYGDRGVSVKWDERTVCEHCGYEWGVPVGSPHNGGCCSKDAEAFEADEPDTPAF